MLRTLQAMVGDSSELAQLAEKIWRQHFTPIIGHKQVNYMLENFQSAHAIKEFIENGYEYYFIQIDDLKIGYLALHDRGNHMHLSKFYILKEFRGQGYGKLALNFIKNKVKESGLTRLQLVVNKDNSNTIAAYKKMGFKIIGEPVTDIGGGFVMDDYEFELEL